MEPIKQFMDFLLKKEQEAIYAGDRKAEFERIFKRQVNQHTFSGSSTPIPTI